MQRSDGLTEKRASKTLLEEGPTADQMLPHSAEQVFSVCAAQCAWLSTPFTVVPHPRLRLSQRPYTKRLPDSSKYPVKQNQFVMRTFTVAVDLEELCS